MGQTAERIPKSFILKFNVLFKQEADEWTALCVDYDIASCGSTQEDAFESLLGLVDMYVQDCISECEFPIPTRKVSCEVIEEFISPPHEGVDLSLVSRRVTYPGHANA